MSNHSTTRLPTYRLHQQSGQAIVTLRDGYGGQKDVLLVKYGTKKAGPSTSASSSIGKPAGADSQASRPRRT